MQRRILSILVAVVLLAVVQHSTEAFALQKQQQQQQPRLGSYDNLTAMRALEFCKASYCPGSAIASWTCAACPALHPNFQIHRVYQNASAYTQSFTGYDPSTDRVVLAFRGTVMTSIIDWIKDLTFWKIPYPNPACTGGCEVHKGFYEEWSSFSHRIIPDMVKLMNEHPGSEVLVTGHSLGAAMSVHAALSILRVAPGASLNVINFGEPRVGNTPFAQWAAQQFPRGKQYRVTHKRDPVPHLPPMMMNFVHVWHELWYDNDAAYPWKDCFDGPAREDKGCSDSVVPGDVDDHLLYLGRSTDCNTN